MPHNFQQQDPSINSAIPKSAASPQHGRKAEPKMEKSREPRSFKPRPGH